MQPVLWMQVFWKIFDFHFEDNSNLAQLNLFPANVSILYPLKIPENIGRKWVKYGRLLKNNSEYAFLQNPVILLFNFYLYNFRKYGILDILKYQKENCCKKE